ncbi:MAG: hypothetical protein LDL41_18920 [Coleofasciculus sp. S288]|nr:hypothetical protein [Coleofasciculus sp. S288]
MTTSWLILFDVNRFTVAIDQQQHCFISISQRSPSLYGLDFILLTHCSE